ncbi:MULTISPECIES: branched-chain amino acid ABC transporter permease [unclassified Bradyrhizobium]|uniref:branched-chain amino acid ABC transporter permease n=1 Tax=unclassified Bradyrhizobium TaxID=2631580 RepID=UPI00247AE1E8|nr:MULTISPECIES: branched-chain amino acid ABC transporter permease [unclassified Bradyrhizobium]WGS18569.1 branched-chain amino acid ABC transporter permease [Bradyrhizobium sp. ISRA463]WGS25392.1 branched-chain amino acid ABC transporter permease [Bradyrhizobium sp. ISRA464]
MLVIYVLCKVIATSRWGRAIAAARQNELRAELFGYDTAALKLGIFVLGSGVAGYAGCLFVNWNGFLSPSAFSLSTTAQILIWLIVGGRETFVGPIIGAVALQYMTSRLGNSLFNPPVFLGILLMLMVILLPRGLVPALAEMVALFRRAPDVQTDEARTVGEDAAC